MERCGLISTFSTIWRLEIGWDDKLPTLRADCLERWMENLAANVSQVYERRCYNDENLAN